MGQGRTWRKVRNEEFYDLSPNFIRLIKLRKMILAGHVAHVGDRRDAYSALVGES